MNKSYYALPLLILLAVSIAGCGGGGGHAGGPGSIQGYVFQLQGGGKAVVSRQATPPTGFIPVQGASVTVTSAATGDTTDAAGYFKIGNVDSGTQTVTVSKAGLASVHFPVTVIANQTVDAGTLDGQTILGQKDWTFLVYLDADNDLEEFGILNFNQMEMVGSDAHINIVVQFDRSPGHDTTNGDWVGCRRYFVTKDNDQANIHSTMLQDMGQQNMADPAVLRNFVEWGVTNYPASHYALVLWDHGSGWRSRSVSSRGILYDDTSFAHMSMAQLDQALDIGVKFEVIAIDASLMQMLEVDYEIRDRAEYIVGSEESPPGEGYSYQAFLGPLAADPSMPALDFSKKIVSTYIAAEENRNHATNSVIDPDRLPGLAARVEALAGYLRTNWTAQKSAFDSARAASQAYASYDYKDLFDFAAHLKAVSTDAQVKHLCQDVMDGISDSAASPVLYEEHTGSDVVDSYGIAIYVPADGSYVSSYGTTLTFTQEYPDWAWLLDNL